MSHREKDIERKRRRIEVKCSGCSLKYKVRYDVSREWYRKYKKLGPFKCVGCLGKDRSEKNKKQIGINNPNWKGGRTPEIQKFYCSQEWKDLRSKVFRRDNYTCRDCNKRGGKLEANHIKARCKYPKLRLEESNIETLCKKCHDKKKWMVYK